MHCRVMSRVSLLLAVVCNTACVLPEVSESTTAPPAAEVGAPATSALPAIEMARTDGFRLADASAAMEADASATSDNSTAAGASAPLASTPLCTEHSARCTMNYASREECADGDWKESPCGPGTVCSSNIKDSPGTCRLKAPVCSGSGGRDVCDSRGDLMACTSQEVIESTNSCLMARLCNARLKRCDVDPCIENTRRCRFVNDRWVVVVCAVPSGSATTAWQTETTCPQSATCEMPGESSAWCSSS